MYSIDEATSDYGVEDNLNGFELINDEVIVLQNRNPEDVTLNEIGHALEQAINALGDVNRSYALVKEAITSDNLSARMYALSQGRETRRRYSNCVWMHPEPKRIYAVEMTDDKSSLIYALEEEEVEQKGIFRRIIDAILDMFSSLWKKIVSLFSKGDKTAKDIEEHKAQSHDNIKKAEERVEEAKTAGKSIASTVKLDSSRGVIEGVINEFGFLAKGGDKFTTKDIVSYLENFRGFLAICNEATGTISEITQLMAEAITRIQGGGQGIGAEYITGMSTYAANAYSRITSKMRSETINDALKGKLKLTGNESNIKVWTYDGFRFNATLYVCQFDNADGITVVKSAIMSKETYENKDGLVLEHSNDFSLMSNIVTLAANLEKLHGSTKEKVVEVSNNAIKVNDKIKNDSEELVKAFVNTEDKEIPEKTIEFLKTIGTSLTSLTTSISVGLRQVEKASEQANRYVEFAMSKENQDIVFIL